MKRTRSLRTLIFLFLIITLLTANYGISIGAVWRVDGQNGTDPVDCTGGDTWLTALKTIKKAVGCVSAGDEIWVKGDTYVLNSTITINKAVGIYGGFIGNETQRNQRDWQTNITTVDGDNGGIGLYKFGRCFILNADATLNGLRIVNCYFDGELPNTGGAAIKNQSSFSTITNCTFNDNSALSCGGAIYNEPGSSPVISNCEFNRNSQYTYHDIGYGGAICNDTGSAVTITNCTFNNNRAPVGGAIYGGGAISNCTFKNNRASGADCGHGGAIFGSPFIITNCNFFGNSSNCFGGAISGSGVITNSIFYENSADDVGGGAISIGNDTSTITNCTFYDNTGPPPILSEPYVGGNAINTYRGSATITNSIFWRDNVTTGEEIHNVPGSTATVTYSDIYGGYSGAGNIDEDPLFVDPNNGNFHLTVNSPCIDAGASSIPIEDTPDGLDAVQAPPSDDIDGDSRPRDNGYDIGADEYPGPEYWTDDRRRNAVPPDMGIVVP